MPSPWSPEKSECLGHLDARIDLDGLFVISDYRQDKDGKTTFRGHGVYGWDASKSRYSMYWFDSMSPGFITPAEGIWEGDTLTFTNHSPHGHGRYVYQWTGEDSYTFTMAHSADGEQWDVLMEARFCRVI